MKRENFWALFNVVWYDGVEAYVTKFVCRVDENLTITSDSKRRVKEYIDGNGEVLKYDLLYEMIWDNIIAYKDQQDASIYSRFVEMWLS